ncbi:hypothetical protein [Parapedobacter koreensis]|uniref:NlpE N-terminal domain-containing protein n=1 Tax=Parapedobacter koreensis TaxID=332977 RepID=A0A1H7M9P5_9SPHI|nr:hypothetical protein [Parapedobacter koreensis]SEL07347.1 hypothetical protein SAMN05421740_103404 [Parapedobacter koreensis]
MNTHTYLCIACFALCTACQSGNRSETAAANDTLSQADNLPEDQEQKYCFLRTEGTQQQDSSYVQLVIRGSTVSGIYNTIPYEKDARRGTVLGKLENGAIDLVWTFTQEGMQDTLRVVFTLQDGRLMQKPLTVDTQTGRQVTRDTSGFSVAYEPVDCVAD